VQPTQCQTRGANPRSTWRGWKAIRTPASSTLQCQPQAGNHLQSKPCRSARAAYVRYDMFARVQDLVRARAGWRSARERLSAASPLPRHVRWQWQTSPSRLLRLLDLAWFPSPWPVGCAVPVSEGAAVLGHYCGWKAARRSPSLQCGKVRAAPHYCPPSRPDLTWAACGACARLVAR
jgi:hypothetical protein